MSPIRGDTRGTSRTSRSFLLGLGRFWEPPNPNGHYSQMGLLRFRPAAPPAPPTPPAPEFLDVYEATFNDACAVLRGYRVAGPDIEDAAQDVFAVVARLLGNGVVPDKVRPWVVGIACRVGKCHRRRRFRDAARHEYEADLASFAAPDEWAHREAEANLLEREGLAHRLVKGLANDDRKEVVMRFYVGGQSVKEIAAELDKPEGTVKKQLSCARDSMRRAARRREAGAAMLLPLFGIDELLRSLGDFKAPDDLRSRVRDRLKHLSTVGGGGGGAGDGGGGGQVAPAMPPAPPPAVAAASYGPAALVAAGALGLVLGALWDPLHRSHGDVDARPERMAAAHTADPRTAPAPSAAPSASVLPSLMGTAALTRAPSAADLDAERVVLKEIEAAIVAHDLTAALDGIGNHARRWPTGGQVPGTRENMLRRIDAYIAAHPNDPHVVELRAHGRTP